jgi:hypothetical protein
MWTPLEDVGVHEIGATSLSERREEEVASAFERELRPGLPEQAVTATSDASPLIPERGLPEPVLLRVETTETCHLLPAPRGVTCAMFH